MELWYVYNEIKARVHIFNRIYMKGRLGVSHFEYISQDIDICQKKIPLSLQNAQNKGHCHQHLFDIDKHVFKLTCLLL